MLTMNERASFAAGEYEIVFAIFEDDQLGTTDNAIIIRSAAGAENPSTFSDWSVSREVGNRIFLDLKNATETQRVAWVDWTLDEHRNRRCEYHPFSWIREH